MKIKDELLKLRGIDTNCETEWGINTCSLDAIDELDTNQLIRTLFAKDSVDYGFSAQYLDEPYSEFKNKPVWVSGALLDPYIARFIHAINSIGIRTIQCCDGWHKNMDASGRYAYIKFPDRYSMLLFWIIEEYVFGQKWSSARADEIISWKNIWRPERYPDVYYMGISMPPQISVVLDIPSGDEGNIYIEINKQAAFIEQYKSQLSQIKSEVIKSFIPDSSMGLLSQRRQIINIILPSLITIRSEYEKFDFVIPECFQKIFRK